MQYPRGRASKAQVASRADVSDNVTTVGVRPSAGTVDLLIPKGNVQPMEKSASCARRRNSSNNSVRVLIKTGIKAVAVITRNLEGICMM